MKYTFKEVEAFLQSINGIENLGEIRHSIETSFKYQMEDRCIQSGVVCIEGILHYVDRRFVYCNRSLNGHSWGTTIPNGVCPECFKQETTIQGNQFTLF